MVESLGLRDRKAHGYVQLNPKLSTLNNFRTPPPAAPPLSALHAAEEDIATHPTFGSYRMHITRRGGGHRYVCNFIGLDSTHRLSHSENNLHLGKNILSLRTDMNY